MCTETPLGIIGIMSSTAALEFGFPGLRYAANGCYVGRCAIAARIHTLASSALEPPRRKPRASRTFMAFSPSQVFVASPVLSVCPSTLSSQNRAEGVIGVALLEGYADQTSSATDDRGVSR